MPYVKPKEAKKILGVTDDTLRRWAREGKLPYLQTKGGNRRLYDVGHFLEENNKTRPHQPHPEYKDDCPTETAVDPPEGGKEKYIYCRVSSNKQRNDLNRQAEYLSKKYPGHKVVKEIASGINFKRKGLQPTNRPTRSFVTPYSFFYRPKNVPKTVPSLIFLYESV